MVYVLFLQYLPVTGEKKCSLFSLAFEREQSLKPASVLDQQKDVDLHKNAKCKHEYLEGRKLTW